MNLEGELTGYGNFTTVDGTSMGMFLKGKMFGTEKYYNKERNGQLKLYYVREMRNDEEHGKASVFWAKPYVNQVWENDSMLTETICQTKETFYDHLKGDMQTADDDDWDDYI